MKTEKKIDIFSGGDRPSLFLGRSPKTSKRTAAVHKNVHNLTLNVSTLSLNPKPFKKPQREELSPVDNYHHPNNLPSKNGWRDNDNNHQEWEHDMINDHNGKLYLLNKLIECSKTNILCHDVKSSNRTTAVVQVNGEGDLLCPNRRAGKLSRQKRKTAGGEKLDRYVQFVTDNSKRLREKEIKAVYSNKNHKPAVINNEIIRANRMIANKIINAMSTIPKANKKTNGRTS